MRKIGELPAEAQARRLAAYLTSRGMPAQAEASRGGAWEVWVLDDQHLDAAGEELQRFQAEPDAARYSQGAKEAERKKAEEEAQWKRARSRIIDARVQSGLFATNLMGPVTLGFILLCVGLFILGLLGHQKELERWFFISRVYPQLTGLWLPEIQKGQVWRLFTPCLLHAGILHILFNMLWLRQFGSNIESVEGSWYLLAQVIVFGIAGNLAQYFLVGPFFLGMSGVNFGLFGYMFICGRQDVKRAYRLDRDTVVLLFVWFLLGFTGLVGPIANAAHAGGLVAGVLWATVVSRQIPFTRIRW